MLALDPKMSLYLHVDAVMVWMRLMLLNAALPSFYTPSRFERSCTTGLVMPLYYTLRSVTCSVCTSLTHFSTRVQSERFTLAACQRPSRWAFLAPARKLCAFAAVIYTVMTSTYAALHDSPINPYYLSRFICLAHCEWWGQQPRSRYACWTLVLSFHSSGPLARCFSSLFLILSLFIYYREKLVVREYVSQNTKQVYWICLFFNYKFCPGTSKDAYVYIIIRINWIEFLIHVKNFCCENSVGHSCERNITTINYRRGFPNIYNLIQFTFKRGRHDSSLKIETEFLIDSLFSFWHYCVHNWRMKGKLVCVRIRIRTLNKNDSRMSLKSTTRGQ